MSEPSWKFWTPGRLRALRDPGMPETSAVFEAFALLLESLPQEFDSQVCTMADNAGDWEFIPVPKGVMSAGDSVRVIKIEVRR